LRGVAAWDGVIASVVGQFRDMGLNRSLMGIDPSYSPLVLASAYGGVLGAASVMLACAAGRRGQVIEVPLAAALLEGLVFNSMQVETMPARYLGHREREILRRREANLGFDVSYDDLQDFLDPFYRSYMCRDGRPYYLVACGHADHPVKALRLLGLWDEFVAEGLPLGDAYSSSREWPDGQECVLSSYPLSRQWSDRLAERLKAVFLDRTAFEWEQLFGEAGVPGAAHRTTEEWLSSEHALTAGLLVDADHPTYGRLRQPGPVVWFEDMVGSPRAGADVGPVGKSGCQDGKPEAGTGGDARWLAGMKVLDLTNVIAGPMIAHMFARFGAEVIKIDPVNPPFDPWTTIGFGIAANRGKRSLLLDLKTPDGQRLLDTLLADADVVLVNAVESQAQRLGLTAQRLAAANPRAILCRIDAFGGPRPGPNSEYYGYDDAVQAATGIMSRFGGSIETPEEHAHVGTIDVLCGFAATFACAVALHARRRGMAIGVARTSLAAAGQLIQLPFMVDYAGRPHGNEPSGRHVCGDHPLYRFYRTADGWMFLAGRPDQTDALLDLVGARFVASPTANVEATLEYVFRTAPTRHWQRLLRKPGIEIVPMRRLVDIRHDALLYKHRTRSPENRPTILFARHGDHPAGPVQLLEPCGISVSGQLPAPLTAAPKYGAHSVDILAEIGCSRPDIDGLIARRIVSCSWSEDYLPD
jgi:crotonobetainyl-CoA:carnitine CoA-transferase CaiB-like acyl-CoA transferase